MTNPNFEGFSISELEQIADNVDGRSGYEMKAMRLREHIARRKQNDKTA